MDGRSAVDDPGHWHPIHDDPKTPVDTLGFRIQRVKGDSGTVNATLRGTELQCCDDGQRIGQRDKIPTHRRRSSQRNWTCCAPSVRLSNSKENRGEDVEEKKLVEKKRKRWNTYRNENGALRVAPPSSVFLLAHFSFRRSAPDSAHLLPAAFLKSVKAARKQTMPPGTRCNG